MSETNNEGGRPAITPEQKKEILQKLEPYLKSGLSIRKALLEAQIPNSTFYKLMGEDNEFMESVNRYRNFLSVLLNNTIVRHLQLIIQKQNDSQKLTKEDISFMQWFANNSNLAREEWGERKEVGLYDPEVEIQKIARIIDSSAKDSK